MKIITVVKVGTIDRPATQNDIDEVGEILSKSPNAHFFVFSHSVSLEKFRVTDNQRLIISVGNDDNPASEEDVKSMEKDLSKIFESDDETVTLITHHAVTVQCVDFSK